MTLGTAICGNHLSQVEKPKEAVKSLAEFRARMPQWRKPSADLLRETRKESL